ncbi:membrane protein insertase YidC [Aureivirga sp. CE67]|uniref:membrane protein insertase YidC n=1 Tax=Aureivirga sp. CE67 TaxID=1788983 RepID=UPI0018C90634|nr:membrane protein insertase YidC [Aureivirga sp. CE67]
MEEKKFDAKSLLGFTLLFGLMLVFFYMNQPSEEELAAQAKEAKAQDSIAASKKEITSPKTASFTDMPDSLAIEKAKGELGHFAYSATKAEDKTTELKNNLVKFDISNKGGFINQAELLTYKTYDSLPLYLIKDGSAKFNLSFQTSDNRTLNSEDLYFEPTLTKSGENQVLSMKLRVSETQFLEYRYEMKPNDYMVDFSIRSQGLGNVFNTSQPINLTWKAEGLRHEKSMKYENQHTALYYEKDGDKVDYLSVGGDDNEKEENVTWVGFKQHFFSTILITDKAFTTAELESTNVFKDVETDTTITKDFAMITPLELNGGELNYNMKWYYGPNDYNLLKDKYSNYNIYEIVDLGWGIFGVINQYIFYPIFDVLQGLGINYGILIILMTIVIRIIMSPLVYKSYLSSAKMKVLRPEITEINDKLPGKENAMKRQQETMKLYGKAGVSPMAGCIPALLQMPIFFALFRFFPSNIDLRQKGFLWAPDLSSYDSILQLPFNIPIYGDHVGLFPILAAIAIFFYMRMSQSQQMNMQQPTQEGMPDMQKMMKMMMYFSPIMMLVFFNLYASSLSLYYFVSNLLTIIIMFVIKNYIINEDKIHAQIQENKQKPKKQSKFKQRLEDAMKQAQEQQAQQKKKK